MLKLLRFVESEKNADWVLTRFGYGACGLCAVGTIVIWIAIFLKHV